MLKRAFAILGIAALLGACGSPPPASEASREPSNLIALAADTMRDAGSMSFEMTMSTTGEGLSMEISGGGVADMAARVMQMEMEAPGAPGAAGDQRIELRTIGDFMYVNFGSTQSLGLPPGKTWMRIDLTKAGGGIRDQFSTNDPTAWAEYLRGISDDVETLGREEIRGHATTHYRAHVSVEKAIEQLPQDQRDMAGAQLQTFRDQFGLDTYPVEVWIDDDGLIWRQASTLDFGEGSMTMSLDILEYGVTVTVKEPPASEVFDSDGFGGSMSQGGSVTSSP